MKDKIVQFETAKLAKEKGFNISTNHWYNNTKSDIDEDNNHILRVAASHNHNKPKDSITVSAPTQSLLQRWLRETHNIHIFIGYRNNINKWDSHVYPLNMSTEDYIKTRTLNVYKNQEVYDTYEKALEAGLVDGLKLISYRTYKCTFCGNAYTGVTYEDGVGNCCKDKI